MFFIFGISKGSKQLDYHQSMVCNACGRYGNYQVFMEYMFFSLFFIPLIKWNKTYFVKASCCDTLHIIDSELGKRIARGEKITLREEDLHAVHKNREFGMKRCGHCGFTTDEDFKYCPKCANPLK